jgi:cytochrome oxidase Cu insertion factor (SCO1/SenC/PrrC family)
MGGFTFGVPREPQSFIREEDDLEMEMQRGTILMLSIIIGMSIILIVCLQVVRAASPPQPECPSCSSFGVQRFPERKEAPAFSLKAMDGKQVSLRDFRGKAVIVVFWATW